MQSGPQIAIFTAQTSATSLILLESSAQLTAPTTPNALISPGTLERVTWNTSILQLQQRVSTAPFAAGLIVAVPVHQAPV